MSVRDKVDSKIDLSFHSTDEIIAAFENGKMPNKILQNIHLQRWTNNKREWIRELFLQRVKNSIKKTIFVKS